MLIRNKTFIFLLFSLLFFNVNVSAKIIEDNENDNNDGWKHEIAYRPAPILFLHGFGHGDYTSWTEGSKIKADIDIKLNKLFSKYHDKYYERRDYSDSTILEFTRYPYLEIISFIDQENFNNIDQEFIDRNSSIDTYQEGDFYVEQGLRWVGSLGWADKVDKAVQDLLDAYGIDKVVLVGHSMGGLAAREYLTNTKYGLSYKKCKRLIMLGTPNLGANLTRTSDYINKLQKIGWFIPRIFFTTTRIILFDIETVVLLAMKIDSRGDAVKDMLPGGSFISGLNSRNQHYEDVDYYAIIGDDLFLPGDGVVSIESQRGDGALILKAEEIIAADHGHEIVESVKKDFPPFSPLLQFIDCTVPEIEVTSPDINIVTETEEPFIRVAGKVYKEYLPADSILKITKMKEGNSDLITQEAYLAPSDLWNKNDPDSPVAEFDERVDFSEAGMYDICVSVVNPANRFSDSVMFKVRVSEQPQEEPEEEPEEETISIYPKETIRIFGKGNSLDLQLSAEDARLEENVRSWDRFVVGQTLAKYECEGSFYYATGLHRGFISFDTSSLQGRQIISARLVMQCNNIDLSNGGGQFEVRIYTGGEELNNKFGSNSGFTLAAWRNIADIEEFAQDIYELDAAVINTESGMTYFRFCSSNEEDHICLSDPVLIAGGCFSVDPNKMTCEIINWNTFQSYLEVTCSSF